MPTEPIPFDADPWLHWRRRLYGGGKKLHIIIKRSTNTDSWPDLDGLEIRPHYSTNERLFATGILTTKQDDMEFKDQIDSISTQCEAFEVLGPSTPQIVKAKEAIGLPPIRPDGFADVHGEGVIVGVIDNACPFAMDEFRHPTTGESRVIALWDQSRLDRTNPTPPAGFDYGHEVDVARAMALLPTPPPDTVAAWAAFYKRSEYTLRVPVEGNMTPLNQQLEQSEPRRLSSHGSKMTAVAAGKSGLAPAAEIVFVNLPDVPFADPDDVFGSSAAHLLDAIEYIFAVALARQKPAVVNISYSSRVGPRDGTTLFEHAVDELVEDNPRMRSVVFSAGNSANKHGHFFARISPGGHRKATWKVSNGDTTPNMVDIWYDAGDTALTIGLTESSGGNSVGATEVAAGEQAQIVRDGIPIGWIIHRHKKPGVRGHALVALAPKIPKSIDTGGRINGAWELHFKNSSDRAPIAVDAWIERDDFEEDEARTQSTFDMTTFDNTVNGLATGRNTLAVGAAQNDGRRPMAYSSLGPGYNNASLKPDFCAPVGESEDEQIVLPTTIHGKTGEVDGTSAAAAIVTGAIALLYSKAIQTEPSLPLFSEIRTTLKNDAVRPSGGNAKQWGSGIIKLA